MALITLSLSGRHLSINMVICCVLAILLVSFLNEASAACSVEMQGNRIIRRCHTYQACEQSITCFLDSPCIFNEVICIAVRPRIVSTHQIGKPCGTYSIENGKIENGTIVHPADGSSYENNESCEWFIYSYVPLYFYFSKFSTEPGYDYFFAHDGNRIGSTLIEQLSGESQSSTFTTVGDAYLRFVSDESNVGSGFILHWSIIPSIFRIKHKSSGKFIRPENSDIKHLSRLSVSSQIDYYNDFHFEMNDFERRLGYIVHIASGKAVHPYRGSKNPGDGTLLVLHPDRAPQALFSLDIERDHIVHSGGKQVHLESGRNRDPPFGTHMVIWGGVHSGMEFNFVPTNGGGGGSDCNCDYSTFSSSHTMNKYTGPDQSCGAHTKTGVTDDEIKTILKTHNELREKVAKGLETKGSPGPQPSAKNMLELKWNCELAEVAQKWAEQCKVGHDDERKICNRDYYVGQNAYGSFSHSAASKWESAITSWYSEVKDMPKSVVESFDSSLLYEIGHYTQVVWAKTYEIGCGGIDYPASRGGRTYPESKVYVCNYGPGGNYGVSKIYEDGEAASNCPNGASSDYPGLCAPPS